MRRIILIFGMLLLSIVLVLANEGHKSEIEEGQKLVESAISCDKLTNEQLEAMGDYYMEQMHPGEAHEMMHEMMGGHDSELTKNMHVNMAKSIYCGETNQGMMGMMNMMASGDGMMDNNMMGSGMMNMHGRDMMTGGMVDRSMMGGNMMAGRYGNYNSGFVILPWITYVLIIMLIVSAIYWLIKSANTKSIRRKLDERR